MLVYFYIYLNIFHSVELLAVTELAVNVAYHDINFVIALCYIYKILCYIILYFFFSMPHT